MSDCMTSRSARAGHTIHIKQLRKSRLRANIQSRSRASLKKHLILMYFILGAEACADPTCSLLWNRLSSKAFVLFWNSQHTLFMQYQIKHEMGGGGGGGFFYNKLSISRCCEEEHEHHSVSALSLLLQPGSSKSILLLLPPHPSFHTSYIPRKKKTAIPSFYI